MFLGIPCRAFMPFSGRVEGHDLLGYVGSCVGLVVIDYGGVPCPLYIWCITGGLPSPLLSLASMDGGVA